MTPTQSLEKKILIVEDDPETRDSLKQVLEERGYSVMTAPNGRIGLRRLEKARPALVLLDLMMPEGNGWDFLENKGADESTAGIPVVVISAFPESAKLLPVNACLKKPLHLDLLIRTVEQYCA